jgi:ParB-like chromosome segregation protein Spo0J
MTQSNPKVVSTGFELDVLTLNLDQLLPTKQLSEPIRSSTKYKAIVSSIQEVGLIEPLIVFRQPDGSYLLLDGNARYHALRALGIAQAPCLLSTDDEAYTYNTKVNRVSPIQAYRMIKKALDAGVPEERIAKALNWSPKTVGNTRSILSNICPEAVEILKDKPIALTALREIKKVKPLRQIEIAELMRSSGNYGSPYCRALVATSARDQFVDVDGKRKRSEPVRPEELARIEHELKARERDFLLLDDTYARNVMDLTLAKTYLKRLLENSRIVRYLAQRHADLLNEFQEILDASSLEG